MTKSTSDASNTQFLRLRNVDCPYCGVQLVKANRTRDHVIGVNFVPPGVLAGEWNLILGACRECNHEKSGLEDDISAITLLACATSLSGGVSPTVAERARQKSLKSISRLTAKAVADSSENLKLSLQRGTAVLTLGLDAPPQIERRRSARLAWMQLRAFTYFIAYDEVSKSSAPGPADMVIVSEAPRSDWGNVAQLAFAKHVSDWEPRLVVTTASGFFRIAVRREAGQSCWSWAMEWNMQRRFVGFFGEPHAVKTNEQLMPQPKRTLLDRLPNGGARTYYKETPLADHEDILFDDARANS